MSARGWNHQYPDSTQTLFREGIDLTLRDLRVGSPVQIATLGPGGTSSEATARVLAVALAYRGHEQTRVRLHESYEAAAGEVLGGRAQLLVASNAFAGISAFYMNPLLRLAAVFVKGTPSLGLAAACPPGAAPLRVASHLAPNPLIDELMPPDLAVRQVVEVPSSSAAAAEVAAGRADAALTTQSAATRHGLSFFSRRRSIRMLWSVFEADLRRVRPGDPVVPGQRGPAKVSAGPHDPLR